MRLALAAFTLSWTHSVERTRWEEDWIVGSAGFRLAEARIKGSGAGMEPAADAKLIDGWWIYNPKVPAQRQVVLAASGVKPGGWSLCGGGTCRTLGSEAGEPVTLSICD